jgi:hypothetical protein
MAATESHVNDGCSLDTEEAKTVMTSGVSSYIVENVKPIIIF